MRLRVETVVAPYASPLHEWAYLVPQHHGLGRKHNGLQPRCAHLVHGGARHRQRQARAKGCLACWCLAKVGAHHVAHEHLIHGAGVNTCQPPNEICHHVPHRTQSVQ